MPSAEDVGFRLEIVYKNDINGDEKIFSKDFTMDQRLSSVSKYIHDTQKEFKPKDSQLNWIVSYELSFLVEDELF